MQLGHREPSMAIVPIPRLTPGWVCGLALVILASWTPYILACAPVYVGPDTVVQILWARGYPVFDPSSGASLQGFAASDHHPYLATLVFGFFDWLGRTYLGGDAAGLHLALWFQDAMIALALAVLVCYISDRLGAHPVLGWGSLAFYCLVPCFGAMSVELVKDLLSMPWFIFWAILYTDLYVDDGWPAWKWMAFLMAGVLGALLRKTLVYIELVCLGIAFVAHPRLRRQIAMQAAALAIVVLLVVQGVVYPALRVAPGGPQEMLAVPLHQTAVACKEHLDEMSQGDKTAISRVLDIDEAVSALSFESSDSVKDRAYIRSSTRFDRVGYLLTWFKQAFLFPGSYLRGVGYLRSYFMDDVLCVNLPCLRWGWAEYGGNDVLAEYPPWQPGEGAPSTPGQDQVSGILQAAHSLPIVGQLMSLRTYACLLPLLAIALCLLRRNPDAALALAPLFVSVLVLLLVPAPQPRYAINLMYLAPLLLALPLSLGGTCRNGL